MFAAGCLLLLAACSGLHGAVSLPPTATLSASSGSIVSGQSTTLTWSVSNATLVSIDQGVGSNLAASGSATVSPTQTTTYTITATNPGGSITATATVTVTLPTAPTVTLSANPTTINFGQSTVLTVVTTNVASVVISNNLDATTFTLPAGGGTQSVSPTKTVTYTATATGNGQTATATASVTVNPATLQTIQHVVFMLQENRSFDSYFGMLNPYRKGNNLAVGDDGVEYDVDGIDDKIPGATPTPISNDDDEGQAFTLFNTTSSCLDDMTSAWLESYGDVNRFDFLLTRTIPMDGFVHTAEGFAKGNSQPTFSDKVGRRAMAYYDQTFLNYYYYMASQFAVADRWFSPVASKSTPNRIATYAGGTTQGLVRDPGQDDKLPQLLIETIFQELDQAGVSWKVYYSITQNQCPAGSDDCTNSGNPYPSTTFSAFGWGNKYLYPNPTKVACTGTTVASSIVGDASNSFCIDPTRIAPITQYFLDVQANTLPSFAYIEAAYGNGDEHPGDGQSILTGQQKVANIVNALMNSPSWDSSVFFLGYDEGGGPYDHVPPVPTHTNDFTTPAVVANYPVDISSIAVNADTYLPCVPLQTIPPIPPFLPGWATTHCDLLPGMNGNPPTEPGANPNDAPALQGFAAQLGFRVPNIIISPFTRKHYVGHAPMDHTAILRFVEGRFLPGSAHLTPRVTAQPDLLDFFDFTGAPWAVPPSKSDTAFPLPLTDPGNTTCHAATMQ
ncbi:MAG: alkaline phosphatase family protein [Acidobacteriaceae bacterium]